MDTLRGFRKIGRNVHEMTADDGRGMRVPARIFADEEILENAASDKSLDQLVNTASLPGVVAQVMAMPDCHQGYGFPIGGVVATSYPDGVICPGGVGYDINCGIRLLTTRLSAGEMLPFADKLAADLFTSCPSGTGATGLIRLIERDMDAVLTTGAAWAIEVGCGEPADLDHTEDRGCVEGVDVVACSAKARDRGREQLGTLGSGNHFVEVDRVSAIFDADAARAFGLFADQVVIQIHCGSRGLGHQICTDHVAGMQAATRKYGLNSPDRQLAAVPIESKEGQSYLSAMGAAANYAWANRQVLTHRVREALERTLRDLGDTSVSVLYDVAHNIAKIEEHVVGGERTTVCVHRKGATRAFGPGNRALPADYLSVGQPVLVPGSMGTSSYVLAGTHEAMSLSFGSACHGAGRTMSRKQALRAGHGRDVQAELESNGIRVRTGSLRGLAEERPGAYKDVDKVVRVVSDAGLARLVTQLEPLIVIKR